MVYRCHGRAFHISGMEKLTSEGQQWQRGGGEEEKNKYCSQEVTIHYGTKISFAVFLEAIFLNGDVDLKIKRQKKRWPHFLKEPSGTFCKS